jgi:hypothetical protein
MINKKISGASRDMIKTKRFCQGRFNYSVKYHQFQMKVIDEVTGKETMELFHEEVVKYFELPFKLGTQTQIGLCTNTGDYYRQ